LLRSGRHIAFGFNGEREHRNGDKKNDNFHRRRGCPGLNAVIRAIVLTARNLGIAFGDWSEIDVKLPALG
jgi:hypothetical protein